MLHCQEKIGQLAQKYNDLSKVSGLPTKIDRLRVEGYNKISVQNRSVNIESGYVERINLNDIDLKLKEYENSIYKNDYESAFVIQKDGMVTKFVGDNDSIQMQGVDFDKAIITHNHPPDDDVYRSFGADDFMFLKNHNIAKMRAINLQYEYEIKKIKDIDISYNDVYKEALTKLFQDESLEIQHETMNILKERGCVDYERRNRKGN